MGTRTVVGADGRSKAARPQRKSGARSRTGRERAIWRETADGAAVWAEVRVRGALCCRAFDLAEASGDDLAAAPSAGSAGALVLVGTCRLVERSRQTRRRAIGVPAGRAGRARSGGPPVGRCRRACRQRRRGRAGAHGADDALRRASAVVAAVRRTKRVADGARAAGRRAWLAKACRAAVVQRAVPRARLAVAGGCAVGVRLKCLLLGRADRDVSGATAGRVHGGDADEHQQQERGEDADPTGWAHAHECPLRSPSIKDWSFHRWSRPHGQVIVQNGPCRATAPPSHERAQAKQECPIAARQVGKRQFGPKRRMSGPSGHWDVSDAQL